MLAMYGGQIAVFASRYVAIFPGVGIELIPVYLGYSYLGQKRQYAATVHSLHGWGHHLFWWLP